VCVLLIDRSRLYEACRDARAGIDSFTLASVLSYSSVVRFARSNITATFIQPIGLSGRLALISLTQQAAAMSTRAIRITGFPSFVLAMALGSAHAQTSDSPDKWRYEVMPYLWGAGIEGREGVGGVTADVSASARDLVDFVNIGASVRISGSKSPFGWYGEASYVGLQDDVHTAAFGDIRVKSSQTLAELELSLDILPPLGLSVYVGARYQDQNAVLQALGLRRDGDRSWVDGLAGVKWTLPSSSSIGQRGLEPTSAQAGPTSYGWLKSAAASAGARVGPRICTIARSIRTITTAAFYMTSG
jgi:hypothetical protein